MNIETKRKLIRVVFGGIWIAFVAVSVVAFVLFWQHNCASWSVSDETTMRSLQLLGRKA